MNQTRQASPGLAADTSDLALLGPLYAHYASPDGLGADNSADAKAALLDAARAARSLAELRVPGDPLIEVRGPGSSHPGTVVEIVTDDLPYLVESVLAGVSRVGGRVRRVIHPVVLVRRAASGELAEVLPAEVEVAPSEQSGVIPEMWIHLELEPFPADEAEDLATELRRVLGDVREVVEDRERMAATARRVAAELVDRPAPLSDVEVRDTAHLLQWLADGHFTFLGYRRYVVGRDAGEPRLRAALASGLGVLRRDSLTSHALVPTTDTGSGIPPLLVLTRARTRSRVIRPVYPYHLAVTTYDSDGWITGEHRFLGILTATAQQENVLDIPAVGRRVRAAIQRAGFPLESYSGQRMLEVISEYPREELFWASEASLHATAVGVLSLTQPRRLRLFLRREPYRRFFSCLVYLPTDRYSTRTRLALQQVLLRELDGWRIDHTARIGESSLALVHFVVHADPDTPDPDQVRLQGQLAAAILAWDDWVLDVAGTADGEIGAYLSGVPDGYRDDVDPVRAVADLRRIRHLGAEPEFCLEPGAEPAEMRFRLFMAGAAVTLSAVLPVLQSLGVEVLDERPYQLIRPDGSQCLIYDFGLRVDEPTRQAMSERPWEVIQHEFCDAFRAAWFGDAEVDRFNALVLRTGLGWREAALLRAYAGFARQLASPFGLEYVANTLIAYPVVTRALVQMFVDRFDPEPSSADRERTYVESLGTATALVDDVIVLDADRILRGYLTAILATLRTNYFQERQYFSIKIDSAAIPEMPTPLPRFDIFVYSPRVEGVHLRFGSVARGGLRWSDRPQDYRTEVLGLVKAQAVKNAVIIPVGAKGGFVVKASRPGPDEVTACYRAFISGLLDLTDNLVDGATVPPARVVRYDGDDSYLVVAADKGTARFSDIGNEVAASYGFWLGDGFASGGSVGYDHKAMGITAKGAWESVKRHFRELGVDTQSEPFTVVGIGDMSGDVFGNGLLLSRHIRLLAAFDHRHVFVDPDPDPTTSFAERARLFGLPRSSWDDYNRALISAGGGVWARTAKSVPIGPAVRAALGLDDTVTELNAPELVRSIVLAPADLLWNGGIGTYVKAGTETHAEVGDKVNDAVRVDGADLRVRVIGEGGNLGLTQGGRIEFARAGGKINTDAVDNSAGVDCSDHEVNIKILLDQLVRSGALGRADRNQLLREMTDDVAALVLANNRAQNEVLGVGRAQAAPMVSVHARMVADLVTRRGLDRALEMLPDPAGFAALERAGRGLCSPQLATLLAHVKLDLKLEILRTDLPDRTPFAGRLVEYFPPALTEQFGAVLSDHPLCREIVTTTLVNEMVDRGGTSYAFRLGEELRATPTDAMRAFRVTAEVFDLSGLWTELDALPAAVASDATDQIVLESRRLIDTASRWLLWHRPQPLAVAEEIARFAPVVRRLAPRLPELLRGREADAVRDRVEELVSLGVPRTLALRTAALLPGCGLLDVVEVTEQSAGERDRVPIEQVVELYFALSERRWSATPVHDPSSGDRWTAPDRPR